MLFGQKSWKTLFFYRTISYDSDCFGEFIWKSSLRTVLREQIFELSPAKTGDSVRTTGYSAVNATVATPTLAAKRPTLPVPVSLGLRVTDLRKLTHINQPKKSTFRKIGQLWLSLSLTHCSPHAMFVLCYDRSIMLLWERICTECLRFCSDLGGCFVPAYEEGLYSEVGESNPRFDVKAYSKTMLRNFCVLF